MNWVISRIVQSSSWILQELAHLFHDFQLFQGDSSCASFYEDVLIKFILGIYCAFSAFEGLYVLNVYMLYMLYRYICCTMYSTYPFILFTVDYSWIISCVNIHIDNSLTKHWVNLMLILLKVYDNEMIHLRCYFDCKVSFISLFTFFPNYAAPSFFFRIL